MNNSQLATEFWSNSDPVDAWEALNDSTGGDGIGHSNCNKIRELLVALDALKKDNESAFTQGLDPELIADSTAYHATKFISKLPDSLETPELDVDLEGNIEFEWSQGRMSFSIYITDTAKVVYAGVFSRTKYFSGSFSIDEELDQSIINHIRAIYSDPLFHAQA